MPKLLKLPLIAAVILALLTTTGCQLLFGKRSGWFDAETAQQWLAKTAESLGTNQVMTLRVSDSYVAADFVVGNEVIKSYTGDRPEQWQSEPLELAGRPIELAAIDLGRLIETTRSFFGDCAAEELSFAVVQSAYDMHYVVSQCGSEQAPFYFLDGTFFADIDVDHQAGLAAAIERIGRGAPDQVYWVHFTNDSRGDWLETVYADPGQGPVELFFQASSGVNSSSQVTEDGPTFSLASLDAKRIISCLDTIGERDGSFGVWTLDIEPDAAGRLEYTWNLKGGWTSPKAYITTDADCNEIS